MWLQEGGMLSGQCPRPPPEGGLLSCPFTPALTILLFGLLSALLPPPLLPSPAPPPVRPCVGPGPQVLRAAGGHLAVLVEGAVSNLTDTCQDHCGPLERCYKE